MTSLLRKARKDRGAKRLGDEMEKLIVDVINKYYFEVKDKFDYIFLHPGKR